MPDPDLALGLDRLKPGAACNVFHSYAAMKESYEGKRQGDADNVAHNAALGHGKFPTEAELIAAAEVALDEHNAKEAAVDAARADADAVVDKLRAGTASPREVQAALASLLGNG